MMVESYSEYIDYGYIDTLPDIDMSCNTILPIANVIQMNPSEILNRNILNNDVNVNYNNNNNYNCNYNGIPIDQLRKKIKKEQYFIFKLMAFITITIILYVLFVNLIKST